MWASAPRSSMSAHTTQEPSSFDDFYAAYRLSTPTTREPSPAKPQRPAASSHGHSSRPTQPPTQVTQPASLDAYSSYSRYAHDPAAAPSKRPSNGNMFQSDMYAAATAYGRLSRDTSPSKAQRGVTPSQTPSMQYTTGTQAQYSSPRGVPSRYTTDLPAANAGAAGMRQYSQVPQQPSAQYKPRSSEPLGQPQPMAPESFTNYDLRDALGRRDPSPVKVERPAGNAAAGHTAPQSDGFTNELRNALGRINT